MILPLVLLTVAFCSLAVLLGRDFLRIRKFSKEELLKGIRGTDFFWNEFHDFFVSPVVRIHQENVRPKTYKEMEKLARRFRIIALRSECLLMRFSEYLRGKRTMQGNGHKSHYWEQLNNCKNGANDNSNDVHSNNPSV